MIFPRCKVRVKTSVFSSHQLKIFNIFPVIRADIFCFFRRFLSGHFERFTNLFVKLQKHANNLCFTFWLEYKSYKRLEITLIQKCLFWQSPTVSWGPLDNCSLTYPTTGSSSASMEKTLQANIGNNFDIQMRTAVSID